MVFSKAQGISPYLLFLVSITVLGPLQFGYHLAELNAPAEALRCKPTTPKLFDSYRSRPSDRTALPTCISMSNAEFGLVTSIYTLGGFIGALGAGPLSSRKGRLFPMRIVSPCFIIGSLMEAVAPSIPVMALGRLLAGIGAGACMVVGPVYVSEIAPSKSKGTLGASTQVAVNLGILAAQVLGYFLSYGSMWRVVLGVASGIAVLHFVGLLSGIESPEWLGSKGKTSAAKRALYKIRSGSLLDDEVTKWSSLEDDEASPAHDEQQSLLAPSRSSSNFGGYSKESIGMWQILGHPDHYRAIIAIIGVMLAQQLCGINAVMMYSVSFLSPILPTGAGLITVTVGALNVVVTILCAPLADRLGRKVCILLSIAGMGLNAILLGFGIIYGVGILTAVATLLFVASFAVGLGPVPFILASELVGPEAVGATQSWALAANWAATFVVAQFFPIVNTALGKGKIFFVFAALALLFFTFIAWWVPESKGKANADEVWGRERRVD